MQETQVQSLGRADPLEKEMATHSSILAWEIPWTEEPCGLQSTRLPKSQTQFSDQPTKSIDFENGPYQTKKNLMEQEISGKVNFQIFKIKRK